MFQISYLKKTPVLEEKKLYITLKNNKKYEINENDNITNNRFINRK